MLNYKVKGEGWLYGDSQIFQQRLTENIIDPIVSKMSRSGHSGILRQCLHGASFGITENVILPIDAFFEIFSSFFVHTYPN